MRGGGEGYLLYILTQWSKYNMQNTGGTSFVIAYQKYSFYFIHCSLGIHRLKQLKRGGGGKIKKMKDKEDSLTVSRF